MTALVLAVREDHERTPSGLASEHVDAAHDDVVESRGSPWRQPIDGAHPIVIIGGSTSQREDRVVEAEERHLIVYRDGAEEILDRPLEPRHDRPHAAADVDGDG